MSGGFTRPVFTVEERDRIRERVLEMAHADARVVAGAEVGSRAAGGGDRWSDLDLTFGLAPGAAARDVLAEWTASLAEEFGAVHLFDLPFLSSIYRVFLFPGHLQVDLSVTPAAEFGALGPSFRLLFGEAVERKPPAPPPVRDHFGLAVHHAVRARFCIERGRVWQAEHWISGVRDEALAIACRRRGLEWRYARGADQLPAEAIAVARESLVRSLDRDELMRALSRAIEALLQESGEVPDLAASVAGSLRSLASEWT
jgi:hypothetical protein